MITLIMTGCYFHHCNKIIEITDFIVTLDPSLTTVTLDIKYSIKIYNGHPPIILEIFIHCSVWYLVVDKHITKSKSIKGD